MSFVTDETLRRALDEAAALIRGGGGARRRGLDLAFTEMDHALREGWFQNVDHVLREYDFETVDVDLAVTVLMTCKPARAWLPSRAAAVERFGLRVRRELPERADAILRFLTDSTR